jgi:hypothetical protein
VLECIDVTGPEGNLPALRVPERYHAGLASLIGLEDEPFQELLSALREEPPALDYVELASRIALKVSAVSSDDVYDILETLDSLYGTRARLGMSVDDFAEAVYRTIEQGDAEELRLPEESGERIRERLAQLLDIDSLDATRKALDVLLEHEHTLHGARIMTDIRPVFGLDASDEPTGAVIVHMLKLSYHDESEDVKEIYLALDTRDIDILIDMLKRANTKADTLERILKRAKVPYIDAG